VLRQFLHFPLSHARVANILIELNANPTMTKLIIVVLALLVVASAEQVIRTSELSSMSLDPPR
jgi:hypothetical protein